MFLVLITLLGRVLASACFVRPSLKKVNYDFDAEFLM